MRQKGEVRLNNRVRVMLIYNRYKIHGEKHVALPSIPGGTDYALLSLLPSDATCSLGFMSPRGLKESVEVGAEGILVLWAVVVLAPRPGLCLILLYKQ